MNHFFCNPFFLYFASWSIVVGLYLLGWSDIYPIISGKLLLFLTVTCIISLLLALYTHKKKWFVYCAVKDPQRYYKFIMRYSKWSYCLLLCEFLYQKSIPLFAYLTGNADEHLYANFGIPIVHIVVINVFFLLFYVSAYCYFSMRKSINIFLFPVLINFLPFLLCVSRGFILYMLFGFFLIALMSCKKVGKVICTLIPIGLLILYVFGLMGNMRIDDSEGNIILNIGEAKTEFRDSGIPSEFFWAYLYISSPLGNLQNTIDKTKRFDPETSNWLNLVVNEMLPVTISKRIGLRMTDRGKYLISDALTVGSTYMGPYTIWGWSGMILVFGAVMSVIAIFSLLVSRKSVLFVPLVVILSILSFFSLFDNMLIFVGLYPQLLLIFLMRNKYNMN